MTRWKAAVLAVASMVALAVGGIAYGLGAGDAR